MWFESPNLQATGAGHTRTRPPPSSPSLFGYLKFAKMGETQKGKTQKRQPKSSFSF